MAEYSVTVKRLPHWAAAQKQGQAARQGRLEGWKMSQFRQEDKVKEPEHLIPNVDSNICFHN